MDSSSSLPANLHREGKPQIRLKSSASMSMEAHVSTTLHRTRTNVNSSHLATSKELDTNKDIESNYSATPGNHNLRWLSFGFWATDLYILRPRLARLRWLLAMYCAFSVLFFSSHMFSKLSQDPKSIERITKAGEPGSIRLIIP